jgi:glutamate synthase (NADPH/NADH) large chain
MIEKHVRWTESAHAMRLLERWPDTARKLVRVLPNDYRRMIEAMERMRAKGLAQEEAELAAFEENARDLARAGGN